MDEFRWILGTISPNDDEFFAIACEYFQRCDRYDASVCTSSYKGEPVPSTPDEWRSIMKHSMDVRNELISHYNISYSTFDDAIKTYSRRFRR